MRPIKINVGCGRLAVFFALAGLLSPLARAGEPPEKIEGAEPVVVAAATNLNRMNIGQPSFKDQIKEDLLRPFHMGSQDSLEPVLPVPSYRPQSREFNKKARDDMKDEVEKIYLGVKDLPNKDGLGEMMGVKNYGPDGREKNAKTPLERFYEGAGAEKPDSSSADSKVTEKLWKGGKDFAGTNVFSQSHYTFKDNFGNGPEETAGQPDNADATAWQPADGAANSDGQLSPEEREERARAIKHTEDFQKLLGNNTPVATQLFGDSRGENRGIFPAVISNPNASGNFGAGSLPGDLPGVPGDSFNSGNSAFGGGGMFNVSAPAPAAPAESSFNPFASGAGAAAGYQSHALDNPTYRSLGMPQPQPSYQAPPTPAATPQSAFGFLPQNAIPARKF